MSAVTSENSNAGLPLVSVVVPVYKVERWLDRCVSSIVHQTYKNLEIILVDDGSPDGSSKKCDEWADRDSRVVVLHRANEGVSAARNAGMDAAHGDYLCFVDSDDAVDLLENLDPEEKEQIVRMLDEDAKKDVKMLLSYDEEEIGSCMTTNYICIPENLTIRQAMSELVKQAGENDNIMTIYVVDEKGVFAGAIDLKDLIRARENAHLEDLVLKSYPYVTDHEKIDDCMDRILDYAEDSIPVLSEDKKILGVITSEDLIEMVDNEMGEDYAKLAGLTAEEDLKEPTLQSMKKRLPWLIILLFLGMGVSSVVGLFENVVAVLPVVICFQSLVLDMAGNVGTQSLAVTIRVLMDENLTGKQKFQLVVKEVKTGSLNGALLGIMALLCLGVYVHLFKGYTWMGAFGISGCVGVSLLVAMAISSAVGTVMPHDFSIRSR